MEAILTAVRDDDVLQLGYSEFELHLVNVLSGAILIHLPTKLWMESGFRDIVRGVHTATDMVRHQVQDQGLHGWHDCWSCARSGWIRSQSRVCLPATFSGSPADVLKPLLRSFRQ